jgi:hypothetical protein
MYQVPGGGPIRQRVLLVPKFRQRHHAPSCDFQITREYGMISPVSNAQTGPKSLEQGGTVQQKEPTLADFESFLNTQSPALRDLTEGQRKDLFDEYLEWRQAEGQRKDLFDEYLKWRQGSSVKPKGTSVKRSSVKRASGARVARAGRVRAGRGVAVRVYRRGVGVGAAAGPGYDYSSGYQTCGFHPYPPCQ